MVSKSDVDPSLVEKNLPFTNNENEEFEKLLTEKSLKIVQPTPGFCVKTFEIGTGTKIFVNICQTDAIPAPKDITVQQLVEMVESDESFEYIVPMSIGQIKTEKDKQGQRAKVCDVVIHPAFFRKINEIQQWKNIFMAIVFENLENKYGLVCVDNKIILKNHKAFGPLQKHSIQQTEVEQIKAEIQKMSAIEELTGEPEKQKNVVIETIPWRTRGRKRVIKQPEYRLFKKKNGRNYLYGEFKFPDIINAKELVLVIGEDRILIESKTRGYLLDIFVPFIIKQKNCTSSFDRKSKILSVSMPLVGG